MKNNYETSQIIDPEYIQVLQGHTAPVLNVKFTSNGAYCISTSQDKTIILWNPYKGTEIKRYSKAHNHEVNDVAIYTDHSKFVSCGAEKFAFLWDITTGNIIRKFAGHNGKLYCGELFANDSILLTGCYDKLVRMFDMRAYNSNKPFFTLNDAKDTISGIKTTDGHQILTTSFDGYFRCYDLRAGKLYADKFKAPIIFGALTSDGRCYSINCLDGNIYLMEFDSGQLLKSYTGHKHTNYFLNSQISADDEYIISGSEDGKICLWDICPDDEINRCYQQELNTSNTSLSKDLFSYEKLQLYNKTRSNNWTSVFTIRFHPSKWLFLSCHHDRNLYFWRKKGDKLD